MVQIKLIGLLGCNYTNELLTQYVQSFKEDCTLEKEDDDDGYFLELYQSGISFHFDEKCNLGTIHLFSGCDDKEPFKTV